MIAMPAARISIGHPRQGGTWCRSSCRVCVGVVLAALLSTGGCRSSISSTDAIAGADGGIAPFHSKSAFETDPWFAEHYSPPNQASDAARHTAAQPPTVAANEDRGDDGVSSWHGNPTRRRLGPTSAEVTTTALSTSRVAADVRPVNHQHDETRAGELSLRPVVVKPALPNPFERSGNAAMQRTLIAEARVSDSFFETDVREALQSLADQASASILLGDDVHGIVTATIRDEPLHAAIDRLLIPLGLHHRFDGQHHYVASADPDGALFALVAIQTEYVTQFRTPEALFGRLPTRQQTFVRVDEHGSRLLIEAPRGIATRITEELRRLDQPIPQVVLEVLVCVYSPETNFRFGFDFEQGVTVSPRNSAILNFDSLGIGAQYGPAGFNGRLNNFRFTNALLRSLEEKGLVKIRAAPRVMAEDGKKAQIHIGRETFFSVQPAGNANFLLRQDIQKVDSGIMLELTPRIRAPMVTVEIEKAEVSEDIRSEETQANAYDRFPVIHRRRVGTTVHVMDGNTIVIGGLTQSQHIDQVNRVPGLSRLPAVGKIFERVERRDQETEVAIFICPRIVRDPAIGPVETASTSDCVVCNE